MVAQYPSGSNTFVPNHDASGKLVVAYSRNVNDFSLNRYVQIAPVKKTTGLYLKMTAEQAARIVNLDETRWPDGAEAPRGEDGTESFEWLPFRCERHSYNTTVGDLAEEQADFALSDVNLANQAQRAMTHRTLEAVTALTTSGNYDAAHTSAVASIPNNSGTWAASTTARQDIKRSLNYAAKIIMKATLGAVKAKDLILVLGPDEASAIAECQELVDHVKHSPKALAQWRGEEMGRNVQYGLPDMLYGYEVVVEDAVRTTSRKGGTVAKGFAWPSATACLVSRPGGLVGRAGGPTFSTITGFIYEKDDMSVETRHDQDNRLQQARVVDNRHFVMTAPTSGFLFTTVR